VDDLAIAGGTRPHMYYRKQVPATLRLGPNGYEAASARGAAAERQASD